MGLTIYLDADSHRKLYEQIYDHIVEDIRAGKLLYEEKLPSTRSLAETLGVSRATVDYAYSQLLAEGYIEAKPCSGYYVCKVDDLLRIQRRDVKKEVPDLQPRTSLEVQIDFNPNGIDMTLFPFDTWRRITRNTLNDDRLELFSSGNAQGDESLRRTISEYLYGARGMETDADHIVVGAGNDYLMLLLRNILGEDRRILMEDPTYKRAYDIFRSMGYEVETIDMDEQGMRTDFLSDSHSDLVYVMPSHQYPAGTVLPIGRRMELLSWATGGERYIIEDDYDSEFRYKGKPIPSLFSSDKNDCVIYMGTFSKSIAPAIRVSFMVLPDSLLERYHEQCSFLSCSVSRLDQAILNEFIRDGYYERYVNKMRKHYRSKHDFMVGQLKTWGSGYRISGENAGLHLLLTSGNGLSGEEMARKAEKMNIKIYALSSLVRDEKLLRKPFYRDTVILGFGGLSEDQIRAGLKLLRISIR